jgi:hypothetical protein
MTDKMVDKTIDSNELKMHQIFDYYLIYGAFN